MNTANERGAPSGRANPKPVVIVGAGVSGLSLAAMLLERGIPVVVLEKEDRVGGLARSFTYGDFTFDIGPHRFHTDLAEVDKFIRRTLGGDARSITRVSWLRFKGRFYPWPLHPPYVLLRFPPMIAFAAMLDLFKGVVGRPTVSFKDQIINTYGRTLYEHFFEGYTAKFLGIDPEKTHPDWAKTGVDRAIIDNRLEMKNLRQVVLRVMNPFRRPPPLRFLYAAGGCEIFAQKLASEIMGRGGEIHCGVGTDALEARGGKIVSVRAGDRVIEPSMVVWTGTIHSLSSGLGLPRPDLDYLPLVCYNLMLSGGETPGFQWAYHGAEDIIFSRTSIPANFDQGNTPRGKRSLCVEVTAANEADDRWVNPEKYLDRVARDLVREGLLERESEIEGSRIEKAPWAYPIYKLDYREKLAAFEKTAADYENLLVAGRLGRFWYNNMDHCIEASFALCDKIAERLAR
jgi:protoporphyrinogen oxidase